MDKRIYAAQLSVAILPLICMTEAVFAQSSPPSNCTVEEDKMGRGENRQCSIRSTNGLSRLVVENRHGTINAYISFNTMLRNHQTLVLRWDEEKAVTTKMLRSSDFEAMFFVNAPSTIAKLAKSKTLMVESETFRRGVSIDTFTITDGAAVATYVLKRVSTQPTSNVGADKAPDKLIQDLQTVLNQRGFNAGAEDGYMGQQTQAAIAAAQRSLGLPLTAMPNETLLAHLQKFSGGIPEGTENGNQSGGSRNDGYGTKVRACIQPGVAFVTPPRSGSGNPAAVHRVQLRSDGTISGVTLTRGSGNSNFDRSVETGIRRCSPFPRPPSGNYPSYIDVNYSMYD